MSPVLNQIIITKVEAQRGGEGGGENLRPVLLCSAPPLLSGPQKDGRSLSVWYYTFLLLLLLFYSRIRLHCMDRCGPDVRKDLCHYNSRPRGCLPPLLRSSSPRPPLPPGFYNPGTPACNVTRRHFETRGFQFSGRASRCVYWPTLQSVTERRQRLDLRS